VKAIGQHADKPFNLNFLCYQPPAPDPVIESRWLERLATYRAAPGVEQATRFARELPAGQLTRELAAGALGRLRGNQ